MVWDFGISKDTRTQSFMVSPSHVAELFLESDIHSGFSDNHWALLYLEDLPVIFTGYLF